jgi:hypothetical protein
VPRWQSTIPRKFLQTFVITRFVSHSILSTSPIIVRVPTTLLAIVDASVGVKNGVDYCCAVTDEAYKNRVGSCYAPSSCLLDPSFISTTGLGLSITSKLVHRLGGTISVDSELGKFAEFTVDLLPFSGAHVDVQGLKKRMRHVCIVLVHPKERFDYSFTTYPVNEDPVPFGLDAIED